MLSEAVDHALAADPDLQLPLAWAAVLLRRPYRMHTAIELAIANRRTTRRHSGDSDLVGEANFVGATAHTIDATRISWDFFQAHALPG